MRKRMRNRQSPSKVHKSRSTSDTADLLSVIVPVWYSGQDGPYFSKNKARTAGMWKGGWDKITKRYVTVKGRPTKETQKKLK